MENWGRLSHLFAAVFLSNFTVYIVNPAIADVTVSAVCGAEEECSLAIYLTGFQQAFAGLGAVVMMPLIGNLSDVYGRKQLLLLPLSLAIIPLVILAWERTTNFFYAYYAFKILTAIVTDGGVICLALSYLADNVSESKRVAAFGLLSGVVSASNVCGTLAARLLSTAHIFQVAAAVSVVALVYATVMVKETSKTGEANLLEQPILAPEIETNRALMINESGKKMNTITGIPSPRDIIQLLKRSTTFSQLSCISFFNSLGDAGVIAFLLYYLKARFHFKKDQFADMLLITYIGSTLSTLIFLPLIGPSIGEKALLTLGLFAGFLNMFLDSIAWSAWVPYFAASLGLLFALATPTIRSLVSKQIGPNEQGIAQGCILGTTAFASLVSPIIYSPLSALFLAEGAPFYFPGFSIFCVGLAYLAGFIVSMFMKPKSTLIQESLKQGYNMHTKSRFLDLLEPHENELTLRPKRILCNSNLLQLTILFPSIPKYKKLLGYFSKLKVMM